MPKHLEADFDKIACLEHWTHAQSQLLQSRPDEGLSAGVHDLALATVLNNRQDLDKVDAEDDRDAAKEDVVVTRPCRGRPRTVPVRHRHLVSDDEVSRALLGDVASWTPLGG